MIKSSKSKLTLLILMSIMLNLALADYKRGFNYGSSDQCPQVGTNNCFSASANLGGSPANVLILPANQVIGCQAYLLDGTCYCNSNDASDPMNPIEITPTSGGVKFGCVPIAQRKVNGICAHTSGNTYSCGCTTTSYTFPVTMLSGDTNNPKTIASGCSKYEIPGCSKWKIKTSATPDLNLMTDDADNDGWTIECGECSAGRTAYSFGTGTGTLTYEAGVIGKGCPLDGTYHVASCDSMSLNTNKEYICACPNN